MKIDEFKFNQLSDLYKSEDLTDNEIKKIEMFGYCPNDRDSIRSDLSIFHKGIIKEDIWITIYKKEDNWYLVHTDEDCVSDQFYKFDGFDEVLKFIKSL